MKNKQPKANKFASLGYTLIELMATTAIIGVLASVAVPIIYDYSIKARVTEGVFILTELRRRIEVGFNQYDAMPDVIPSSPDPDGERFGGPYYNYSTLFGTQHEMWERFEFQHKGPHRVLAIRAYRKEEWENSDIGIHLQIRHNADNTLSFRCTINETLTREKFVPSSCIDGNANEWTGW